MELVGTTLCSCLPVILRSGPNALLRCQVRCVSKRGKMSASPSLALAAGLLEAHRRDQRLHRRYPLTLDVEYKLFRKRQVALHGFGKTLNISSTGVLLSVHDSLPIAGLIELAINWPRFLEGFCPLKLKIRGRIIRSDVKEAAVQIYHDEFRTSGARSTSHRPSD